MQPPTTTTTRRGKRTIVYTPYCHQAPVGFRWAPGVDVAIREALHRVAVDRGVRCIVNQHERTQGLVDMMKAGTLADGDVLLFASLGQLGLEEVAYVAWRLGLELHFAGWHLDSHLRWSMPAGAWSPDGTPSWAAGYEAMVLEDLAMAVGVDSSAHAEQLPAGAAYVLTGLPWAPHYAAPDVAVRWSDRRKEVVCVGGLGSAGGEAFAKAARTLKRRAQHRDWTFRYLGWREGSPPEGAAADAIQAGIVAFEQVDRLQRVLEVIAQARLVYQAARAEVIGYGVLEALACGTLPIAPAEGTAVELFADESWRLLWQPSEDAVGVQMMDLHMTQDGPPRLPPLAGVRGAGTESFVEAVLLGGGDRGHQE